MLEIELLPTDSMPQRVEKAMIYAGFANPDRLGSVHRIAFIMSEYERNFGPVHRAIERNEGV